MIFVYVLYSQDSDRIYIGMTNNLERRLQEHNGGHNKSTKPYLPWEKIYVEEHLNRIDARKREKYFKSFRGREKIRKQILVDFLNL